HEVGRKLSAAGRNGGRNPASGGGDEMTLGALLRQNLFYHWRGNLAVLLGVAVGTAVLTGALLVGDSLRGSLRALASDQLGWVDRALVAGRFFRQELAGKQGADQFSSAIMLQGAASHASDSGAANGRPSVRRAGRLMIMGVDKRLTSADGTRGDTQR